MKDTIIALYEIAYSIWNFFMDWTFPMLKQTPETAFRSNYAAVDAYTSMKYIYDTTRSILLPLACTLILIRIIKGLLSSSIEQIYKQTIPFVVRSVLILVIICNLWAINTAIIQVCGSFGNKIINYVEGVSPNRSNNGSTDVNINTDDGDIGGSSDSYKLSVSDELTNKLEIIEDWSWFGELIPLLVIFFSALGTLGVFVTSGITIMKYVYQRLLKPLMMLPFSGLVVAFSAGTEKMAQSTYNFYKQLILYCLSGAGIAIAISLMKFVTGVSIPIATTSAADSIAGQLVSIFSIILQQLLAPIIITALIKEVNTTFEKFS